MKRHFLLCCCFCVLLLNLADAQGNRKIRYRADMGFYEEDVLPGAQRLIGNVAFAHDNVRGYCDSAYLYEKENYIIAFGDKVKILIGDSVRLYGRRAYYDGNTKIASIAANVRLEKSKAYLLSDSLVYDLNTDYGYYLTGGKIISESDTLTSREGKYYTNTDDAYVSKNVRMYGENYKMDCEDLKYNAASKIAYFISRTHLHTDDNEIYTSRGWYDTQLDRSTLVDDVQFFSKDQTLFADSVYYEKDPEFGRAWNNVTLIDSVQNYILKGNFLEHHKNRGYSFATDSCQLILIDDNADSLYMHSDTLKVYFDEEQDPQLIKAYHKTKFYRSDLQGACDSLVYDVKDSVLTMFNNPVVWSDEYQLTGDSIRFIILDSTNMQMDLCNNGFIVASLYDATEFNQIKGINITGFIRNKELYRVDIINNAECIYFLQEEDSSLIGINTSITSEMRIMLNDNKIQQIRFYDAPDGKIYPDEQLEEKGRRLQNFRWLDAYRPHTIEEIFTNPIPVESEEKTVNSEL